MHLENWFKVVYYSQKITNRYLVMSYFNGKRGGKVAKTPVTKTTGQRIETDGLKGRIGEFNLADLKDEGDGIRDE